MAARQERLKHEEEQRAIRRAAALERAKQQKAQEKDLSPEELAARRAAAVAAARERAAARRAAAGGATNVATATGANANSNTAQDSASTNPNAIKSIRVASKQAQAKAHDMMQHGSKDGMLVAAMMAQGGTSAMLKEQEAMGYSHNHGSGAAANVNTGNTGNNRNSSVADTSAQAASGDENTMQEQLPYALRLGGVVKHADPLLRWPSVTERERDLSLVENPPQEGVYIPESKPRSKTYLTADPLDDKKRHMELPAVLRLSNTAAADNAPASDAAPASDDAADAHRAS